MDEPAVPTSLQRFIQGRGKEFGDLNSEKVLGRAFSRIWLYIVAMPAAVIAITAFTTELSAEQSFAVRMTALPLVILVSGLIASAGLMKSVKKATQTFLGDRTTPILLTNGVTLTPEAQDLVRMLSYRYSATDPAAKANRERMRQMAKRYRAKLAQQNMQMIEALHLKSERDLLSMPNEVSELLEQAAFQYNRAVGLVETAGITDSGPSILKGADEAMVAVLHRARQIVKYPESLNALGAKLTESVENLRQLADTVEAIASRQGSAPTAALGGLLEDLRLQLAALNELSPTPGGESTNVSDQV